MGRQRAGVAGTALGASGEMNATRGLETLLVRGLAAGLGNLSWPRALRAGASLGEAARRIGVRRRVAEANLRLAFPELSDAERAAILARHYRELGRVASEYPRLGTLTRAGAGEVVAEVSGTEHLENVRAAGRGAILLTGHFGNFELLGAWLGKLHPVDFVVKPLSNPGVESLIAGWRAAAGVGTIPLGASLRRVFMALRHNRWVAMLADQDARARGHFVPFFGRLTSTPAGPAELSLRTGAPIVMGFGSRDPDGRHRLEIPAPLVAEDAQAPGAALDLTARHTAALERAVCGHPEAWFWLHRRWKTPPPGADAGGGRT